MTWRVEKCARPSVLAAPLGFSIALALAGCAATVAPPPASTLQTPAAWRTTAGPVQGPAVEKQWWQAFGDPALSALVAKALENNGDLRIARARVAQFRAQVGVTAAAQKPNVFVDTAPTRTRQLAYNGVPYVTNVYQAEFQASYEVDLWGRLAAQTDAATATFQSEQANADAAALSIAGNVASRDLAKRQFDVGYSSRLEWLQAQAEYQTTAEQVPQLKRSIFEQENALSILIGGNPGPIARGTELSQLEPPAVPAGLPSELLRRRPDIARAEFNLIAVNANLKATRDQLLPSFKLTAVGGVQNLNWHDFVNAPTALWRLTGAIAAPVFEGDRVQYQTDAVAAQRDQAVFAYENAVRSAFSETDNSLGAIYQLKEQAVQNDARRATAAETLRIAHNRYRNGYASYLEELDAQRTLYNADVGRLQLKTRILVASVDLYRAMGGGWSPHP
jgi:multidrug efflux system outer membrane protein